MRPVLAASVVLAALCALSGRTWAESPSALPDAGNPDTVPAETIQVDTLPADTIPVDTFPVDTVPADTTQPDSAQPDTVTGPDSLCEPICAEGTCGDNGCGGKCYCPGGYQCDGGACMAITGECGMISIQGCCDNETLKYCQNGSVKTYDCSLNPEGACGWSPLGNKGNGWYDCGTDGASDPDGVYPKDCGQCAGSCEGKECGDDGCGGDCGNCGQGKVCKKGKCAEAASCGEITYAGCCDGETLMYCDTNGILKTADCSQTGPSCGWEPTMGWYDCKTDGSEDPSGKQPKKCPEEQPPAPDVVPGLDTLSPDTVAGEDVPAPSPDAALQDASGGPDSGQGVDSEPQKDAGKKDGGGGGDGGCSMGGACSPAGMVSVLFVIALLRRRRP